MKSWTDRDPTSHAELVDFLVQKFGFGDYDDGGEEPYYRWRMTEIGKVKRQLNKRAMSVEDVVMCARYVEAHRVPVKALWQVLDVYTVARRDAKSRVVSDLARRIREALEVEASSPSAEHDLWVYRLTRAQGEYRGEVLEAWEKARS